MLTQADASLKADVLAELSINDLALLAEARNLSGDYVGTADETGYIGTEKAKEIADCQGRRRRGNLAGDGY